MAAVMQAVSPTTAMEAEGEHEHCSQTPGNDAAIPVKRRRGRPRKEVKAKAPPKSAHARRPTRLKHTKAVTDFTHRMTMHWCNVQPKRRPLPLALRGKRSGRGAHLVLAAKRLERPATEIAQPVEQIYLQAFDACTCLPCHRVRREYRQVALQYRCPILRCKCDFPDFVAFLEHQLDAHGTIYPTCRRVRQELFQQERGKIPCPPETVFIGQQYLYPHVPPSVWTLARVEQEQQSLRAQLEKAPALKSNGWFLWLSFKVAYDDVMRGGLARLNEHYRIAMEHYESSLVFSVGARSVHDSTADIALGRNWLESVEYENADRSSSLGRLGLVPDDKDFDDEVVLFDSGSGWKDGQDELFFEKVRLEGDKLSPPHKIAYQ